MQIADEIYLLSKGSIVASGSPKDMIKGDNELLHQFLTSSGVTALPEKRGKVDKEAG
jgi:ABC-type transporter Mla maintaining outer membrane lipid asymmetry ATPase subunit MlaF